MAAMAVGEPLRQQLQPPPPQQQEQLPPPPLPPPPPPPPQAVSAQPHVADDLRQLADGSGGGGGGGGGGAGAGAGAGAGEGAPIALHLFVEEGLVATVLDAAAHEQQPFVQAAALDVLQHVERSSWWRNSSVARPTRMDPAGSGLLDTR